MKYLVTASQHMLYMNIIYDSAVYLRTSSIGHCYSRDFLVVGRRSCEVPGGGGS